MSVTYRTAVVHLRPTPLGLLGERWTIEHWCNNCRQRVSTDDLITHARHHHDAHSTDDSLPTAARLMHNVRRPDRPDTPNDHQRR